MNILVVGAGSFLGKYLVAALVQNNHSVTGSHHRSEPKNKGYRAITTEEIFSSGSKFDHIYILSSYIPYGSMNTPSQEFVKVNVDLVMRICRQFPQSRIIFASSVSVYGIPTGELNEDSAYNAPDLYGQSKLCGEFIVKNQPSYAIVRFSSLYGKGMNSVTFLPRIINSAREEKDIRLYGDGSRKQDYLHIKDAAGYLVAAADCRRNGTFLGVYGASYSNLQIAGIVADQIPGVTISYTGSDNSPSFSYNNSKTNQYLGFKPSIDPQQGIGTLIHE